MPISELKGFDPLQDQSEGINSGSAVFEDATKRVVHNILRSYTGFYDLFSEAIQNALDAVEMAKRQRGADYVPRVWITIDIPASRFRIVDNGTGMNLEEFKYCFRPNVSFKKAANVRGEKGVGATFLAYGFSFVSLQSKKDGGELAAILRQGRQWAEDERGVIPRPTFELQPFGIAELAGEQSGTCLEIICGKAPGERPKDFTWIGASTAQQWLDVLRIKTPLGGIYLTGSAFAPSTTITVVAAGNTSTTVTTERAEYYYPHEIPDMKVQQLGDIITAQHTIKGDASTKFNALSQEFKRLDCIWQIWDKETLLAEDSDFESALSDSSRELVERHGISIYGAFLSTAKTWARLNDDVLKLRKGQRIMHGGMQLASDNMAQGELSVIPLTSAIGYQNNSHGLIADFDNEVKFPQHVNFVVCWTAGKAYKERFTLDSLLVGDEGSTRQIFGSTHKAYTDGSSSAMFEILVLEDLLSWFTDPLAEEARQKQAYRDR